MPDPPDPHVPGILLATAARLGWRVSSRSPLGIELGQMFDSGGGAHVLTLAGDTSGAIAWAIVDRLPSGFVPVLLTSQAGAILSRATPGENGSVVFACGTYRLRLLFDGALPYADTVAT